MNREKKLLKNTIILFIGTVFPKLATFITLPIITLSLSKSEYGLFELFNTLLSCLVPIVTLQLESALFRYLIEVRNDLNEEIKIISTAVFTIIPCSFIMLVCSVFLLPIFNNVSKIIKILVFLYFFIDSILACFMQTMRGLGKNKLYSIVSSLQAFGNIIFIYLFFNYSLLDLSGVLIALILSLSLGFILVLLIGKMWSYLNFSSYDIKTLNILLKYSLPMIPNGLSAWIISLSDRLIVTYFLGLESTAIYAIANKIPSALNMVQSTFTYAWQENASLSINDSDSEIYFGKIFQNVFDILCSSIALLIACTPILYRILVNGNYDEAYIHMIILFLAFFFNVLSSVIGGIYIAHKKSKDVGLSTIIAATLNVIINIVFINNLKLYAASLSTLISYFALFIYRVIDVQKIQKIKFSFPKILFQILIVVLLLFLGSFRLFVFNLLNVLISIGFIVFLNKKVILKLLKN